MPLVLPGHLFAEVDISSGELAQFRTNGAGAGWAATSQ